MGRTLVTNSQKVFVGKPEDNRKLGRPRCKWKNNMKTDLN
jgi:hypothetical protein